MKVVALPDAAFFYCPYIPVRKNMRLHHIDDKRGSWDTIRNIIAAGFHEITLMRKLDFIELCNVMENKHISTPSMVGYNKKNEPIILWQRGGIFVRFFVSGKDQVELCGSGFPKLTLSVNDFKARLGNKFSPKGYGRIP